MMSNQTQGSARDRISAILDDNSFVEIGAMVKARSTDFNMSDKATPADGVITGYGAVEGIPVYIYSQDASVMNGSIGEMHAKKIVNLYDKAMKTGVPVIGLIDCAGLRLQESTDALSAFGTIYHKQSMASGVIPQITAVYGNCGGGLAIMAAMSDFTFMEKDNAKLFVNSPNALDGNYASKLDTASAKFQSEESGVADFVGTQEEIAEQIRSLVSFLPVNNVDDGAVSDVTDSLNRVCDNIEAKMPDAALALSDIADNGVFIEVKKDYAKSVVTGFIKLDGMTVGAVANRTAVFDENGKASEKFDAVLTPKAAKKAADFVTYCDAFDIPVLTLTNVEGFAATVCAEKNIADAAAAMTMAFAGATVPKVNVVVGKAMGSAYVAMNSKSTGADLEFAWPQASIGMMDSKLAAKIMYADEISKASDPNAVIDEKAAEYASLQSSAQAAASRGYVDAIVEPKETRKYLISAFQMLASKDESIPYKKHASR
ncbi:MAG: acyl-CoA carboxylase subunit beta [Bacteroides sp.]